MPTRRETWLLGTAAALGVVWLASKAKETNFFRLQSDADLEALARMLIAETGFQSSREEMAQIVFIAINRAKRNNVTLKQVVTPPGRPTWNTGALYKKRFDEAPRNILWLDARDFVEQVLAGAYANRGFRGFVHPGGMPVPPCASNRIALSTLAGPRCMPVEYAKGSTTVGKGVFV